MTDPHDRETYTQSLEARCDALVAENEALQEALARHGKFRESAVNLVRDLRLALLHGDYLSKQQMDARSSDWLKDVDGPRPVCAKEPTT